MSRRNFMCLGTLALMPNKAQRHHNIVMFDYVSGNELSNNIQLQSISSFK